MTTPARKLRVVPVEPSVEAELRILLEREAAHRHEGYKLRASISDALRRLADKRGVAFVRVETARREFGGQ